MATHRWAVIVAGLTLIGSSGCSVLPKQEGPAVDARAELAAAVELAVQAGLINVSERHDTDQQAEAEGDVIQSVNDPGPILSAVRWSAIIVLGGLIGLVALALILRRRRRRRRERLAELRRIGER